MVKVRALDADAPGLVIVTLALPAEATSDAGTDATALVDEKTPPDNAAPFHLTTAPLTKPVPVSVNVNPPLPAAAEEGDRLVRCAAGAEMVKVRALDAAAPGLTAVTLAVPAAATSDAWMVAVTLVEETKVVVRA